MQRKFGGSFKGLLLDELEAHYNLVSSEYGTGMFQRMKDMNEQKFSTENAQELYAGLVDEVMSAIRTAISGGESTLDKALARLYSHVERSCVCNQKIDKKSKDIRKKMRAFLEEQYSTPLAELTAITDRCGERNTTPVEVTAIAGQDVPMVQ
ncbi:hypothetical protein EDB19DRAFT_119947 [Suillus lakei]|nr:hypothetical protein EDB19DRAFT_119947 [Suillus lakei]